MFVPSGRFCNTFLLIVLNPLGCSNTLMMSLRRNWWLFWSLSGKESGCQGRRLEPDPWSRKIPPAAEKLSLCPAPLSLCPTAQEPQLLLNLCATMTEAHVPQSPWSATRSHHKNVAHGSQTVAPTGRNKKKKPMQQQRPSAAKINKLIKLFLKEK